MVADEGCRPSRAKSRTATIPYRLIIFEIYPFQFFKCCIFIFLKACILSSLTFYKHISWHNIQWSLYLMDVVLILMFSLLQLLQRKIGGAVGFPSTELRGSTPHSRVPILLKYCLVRKQEDKNGSEILSHRNVQCFKSLLSLSFWLHSKRCIIWDPKKMNEKLLGVPR